MDVILHGDPVALSPPICYGLFMGTARHLSRREIARMIPVLTSGSLLLPVRADRPDTRTPGIIRGKLLDGVTGQPVAAKIRVTNVFSDEAYFPEHAIKTMPQRAPTGVRHYFYARGSYEVAVPPGRYRIEVVRGICHDAAIQNAEIGAGITHVHDFKIPILLDMHSRGWYSGNTHTQLAVQSASAQGTARPPPRP